MLEGKFHQYLQVERNYSPHTILAYTQDLKSFDTFLKEHYSLDIFQEKDAQAVTHRMIRVWMGELLDGGAGNRSVTRKVASLSAYFRYLRKSGTINCTIAT